jgi:hypothetical protein
LVGEGRGALDDADADVFDVDEGREVAVEGENVACYAAAVVDAVEERARDFC